MSFFLNYFNSILHTKHDKLITEKSDFNMITQVGSLERFGCLCVGVGVGGCSWDSCKGKDSKIPLYKTHITLSSCQFEEHFRRNNKLCIHVQTLVTKCNK